MIRERLLSRAPSPNNAFAPAEIHRESGAPAGRTDATAPAHTQHLAPAPHPAVLPKAARFQEPTGPRGKALHAKPPSNDAFTPPPGTYTLPPSFGRTTAADWGTVASRQRPSRWTKDEDRFAYQRRSAAAGTLPAIASPRVSRLMSPARRRGLSGRELLKAVA